MMPPHSVIWIYLAPHDFFDGGAESAVVSTLRLVLLKKLVTEL